MKVGLKAPKAALRVKTTTNNWIYTAVSTKVVQKKRKSVRDNAERWSGKYSINFNKHVKSSESILFLLTHANKYS